MLNPASKTFLALSALLGAFAFVFFAVITVDRAGNVLFLGAVVATMILAFVFTTDIGPEVRADNAISEPVDRELPAQPSVWPIVTGLGIAFVAVGASRNGWLALIAGIVAVLGGFGWSAQSWKADLAWDARLDERFAERVVRPIALPILAFVVLASIAISLSRVFLATSEHAAVAIACGVASVVLVVISLLAARRSVHRNVFAGLAVVGAVAVITSGAVGAAAGEKKVEKVGQVATVKLTVHAKGTAYVQANGHALKTLTVPADAKHVNIGFVNYDDGIYHDVAIYTGKPASSPSPTVNVSGEHPIWNGTPIHGGQKVTYNLPRLSAGTYTFRCDFHPGMVGTLTVQ